MRQKILGLILAVIFMSTGCKAITIQNNEDITLEGTLTHINYMYIEDQRAFLEYVIDTRGEVVYAIKSRIFKENDVRISFPEVEIADAEMQKKINNLIWEDVQILISWVPSDWENTITLDVDYKIMLSTNRMLSIVYTGLYFAQGTPGPTSIFFTTNVNITTGERVMLNDVVNVDESAIELLQSENAIFLIPEQREFVISQFISNEGFLYRLQNANSAEVGEIFVYFTSDSLGISIGGLGRGGGSHAEIEISYKTLLKHHENSSRPLN